jgi:hypothetical protein
MPDLHELLAREASQGGPVSAPPFETLVARSRHRRAMQALAVAGVVVAVTAAIAVPSVAGHHRTAVVAGGPGGATTEAARKAITEQVAEQLVGEVQLPAGAVAQSGAPTSALAQVFNYPGSQNVVDVVRFFTVPGDMYTVIAHAGDRPPPGTVENGTIGIGSSGAGLTDTRGVQGVTFAGQPTHDFGPPTVLMVATKFGSRVAVRVEVQLVWRPLRTAAEYVPAAVTSASRTSSCPLGAACVDPLGVVGGNAARELANYFNSLDTQPPGDIYGCPETASPAIVTFDVPSGPLTFGVTTCGTVTVTASGVAQPALDATNVALDPHMRGLLGLSNGTVASPAPVLSAVSTVSSTAAVAPAVVSNGPPQATH